MPLTYLQVREAYSVAFKLMGTRPTTEHFEGHSDVLKHAKMSIVYYLVKKLNGLFLVATTKALAIVAYRGALCQK
jgi:hypothetical protein